MALVTGFGVVTFLSRLGGMKTKTDKPFVVLEVSLGLVSAVSPLLTALRSRNPDLARQVKRAVQSVPMNIAEGNSRAGRDRAHHFRIASGSAREVMAGLRVALAFGELDTVQVDPAINLADRTVAMLFKLTR